MTLIQPHGEDFRMDKPAAEIEVDGQRQSPRASKAPGRRWTWTAARTCSTTAGLPWTASRRSTRPACPWSLASDRAPANPAVGSRDYGGFAISGSGVRILSPAPIKQGLTGNGKPFFFAVGHSRDTDAQHYAESRNTSGAPGIRAAARGAFPTERIADYSG